MFTRWCHFCRLLVFSQGWKSCLLGHICSFNAPLAIKSRPQVNLFVCFKLYILPVQVVHHFFFFSFFNILQDIRSVWIEFILLKLKIKNWKHYSKIIFKCVNSTIRPIFNEKFDKKWNLWIRKQCTDVLFIKDGQKLWLLFMYRT